MNGAVAEPHEAGPAPETAVSGAATDVPLSLASDLESKIVQEKTETSIECKINGTPSEVLWLRNGKEIKPSADVLLEQSGAVCRLVLQKPGPEDSGAYQCEARSGPATVVSTCSLLVISPEKPPTPKVVKLPQPTTVSEGTPAKFTLELDDISNLTVQWFKGQDKVEKTDRIKSVKSGNTFKLDIKSVEGGDTGQYVVKVIKDKKAIAKYTASLSVIPS